MQNEFPVLVKDLRSSADKLKNVVVTMDGYRRQELRDLMFRLEDVICAVEQKAANAQNLYKGR